MVEKEGCRVRGEAVQGMLCLLKEYTMEGPDQQRLNRYACHLLRIYKPRGTRINE